MNRAHLADLMAERNGLTIPERTIRRVLAEAGLPAVRRRRPRGHRRRRERMTQAGLLLQVDGSRHDWLEGRGPWLTLVGGIDDATGLVTGGVFRDQEDAAGYFEVLTQTATGIAWIAARSPQAKGRIERLWGTLQDRLVVELRLAGATTIEDANGVLASYLARHNDRFAVPPADAGSAWRPLAAAQPAETLFCFRHARRLARDGTLTLNGRSLMLVGRGPRVAGARSVIVQERLDGSLWIELDGRFHAVGPAPERPAVLRETSAPRSTPLPPAHRPRPDHPWLRYPAVRPR